MQSATPTYQRSGIVLIVEDDERYASRVIAPYFSEHWQIVMAHNLPQGLAAASEAKCIRLAIVDLDLPGGATPFNPEIADSHGFQVVQEIRRRSPEISILVLTGYLTAALVNRAHELGAEYVVKGECRRNLELQVHRLLAEEHIRGERSRGIAAFSQEHNLSNRETEVLALAVARATRTEIAEQLGVSQWTVKSQVRSILRKCNAGSLREISGLLRGADND